MLRKTKLRNMPKPSDGSAPWEHARKILEVFALLATGAWTLTTFFSYQYEQEKLRTKQLVLTNGLAETERDSKKVSLEQQKLTLKQAELLASNESERARISLKQQRLQLQQSTLTSQAEIQRANLSARILQLEADLKAREVKSANQGRIQITTKLDLFCGEKPDTYRAEFEHAIVNVSKADVEVSWEIVHRYLGSLVEPAKEAIIAINGPPVGIYGLRSPGSVQWRELGYDAYFYPKSKLQEMLQSSMYDFHEGGGSVKTLRPGDQSHSRKVYLVRGKSEQWLGISLAFGIDGATSGDGTFRETRSEQLADCIKKDHELPVQQIESSTSRTKPVGNRSDQAGG